MKRIKVIRVIARLNIGGPAIHTIILNEGLDKNRFDSHLITGKPAQGEGDMTDLAREKGIKLTIIPELSRKINLWPDMIALWKLFKIIKKEKPDIVHTHTAKAGVLGRSAAILNRVPITVHSFHGHVFHSYFSSTATKVFIFIERIFAKFTDRLIVVSDSIKGDILKHLGTASETKTSVLRLGLNLEKFKNTNQLKGEFRKELNIDTAVLLVGIIGRLTAVKNHKLLFEAIRFLKDESPDLNVRFLIIGDGELRSSLESCAANLGIREWVQFVGWRKDIPRVYADLDIVALTSLNEGTPLSIIEAMAAHKAVVATAVGGVPDLVEDKKNGWLVDSNDAAKLKQALSILLKDEKLRNKIGQTAGLHVYERYSKEQLIENVENLYKDLVTKKNLEKIK